MGLQILIISDKPPIHQPFCDSIHSQCHFFAKKTRQIRKWAVPRLLFYTHTSLVKTLRDITQSGHYSSDGNGTEKKPQRRKQLAETLLQPPSADFPSGKLALYSPQREALPSLWGVCQKILLPMPVSSVFLPAMLDRQALPPAPSPAGYHDPTSQYALATSSQYFQRYT